MDEMTHRLIEQALLMGGALLIVVVISWKHLGLRFRRKHNKKERR